MLQIPGGRLRQAPSRFNWLSPTQAQRENAAFSSFREQSWDKQYANRSAGT